MSSNLIPQILPNFVIQRTLYGSRERPAKTYPWQIFIVSNMLIEVPWNTLMGILIFISWYFPVGLYRNAELTDAVGEQAVLCFY